MYYSWQDELIAFIVAIMSMIVILSAVMLAPKDITSGIKKGYSAVKLKEKLADNARDAKKLHGCAFSGKL